MNYNWVKCPIQLQNRLFEKKFLKLGKEFKKMTSKELNMKRMEGWARLTLDSFHRKIQEEHFEYLMNIKVLEN